jgi:hypothetical protein
MHNASNPQRPPAVYVLPEKAHLELVELREHLRLMGRLAEPGTAASDHDNLLQPHALAWWFKRLRRDVDRILKSTYWSAELQDRAPPR